MSDWLIAVLAWVGFSPILGIALGKFIGRADELSRTHGDPALNLRRPAALPVVIATQAVPAKAYSRSLTS